MPRPMPSKKAAHRQSMSKAEGQAKFDFIAKGAEAAKVGSSRMGELGLTEDKAEQKKRASEIIIKHGGGRKGPKRYT